MRTTAERKPVLVNDNQLEEVPGITPEYPYMDILSDLTHTVLPWHWHEEVEFVKVLKGCEEVLTNHGKYEIAAGDAYFVNTNVITMKKKSARSLETVELAHLFHPILISGHFGSVMERKYTKPILQDPSVEVVIFSADTANGKEFIRLLDELTDLQDISLRDNVSCEMQTRNLLSEMWLLLIKELQENPESQRHYFSENDQRLRIMMKFVNGNFSRRLALSDISGSAYISDRECQRIFKKELGVSPIEYLTEVRLERARQMLSAGGQSITEIAVNCGFSDASYFGRVYREHYGTSPSDSRSVE